MNKKVKYLSISIIIVGILLYILYTFVIAPTKNLRPIYVIPSNAVFFLETEKPIVTWEKIRTNTIWGHLKKHTYFSELTENANTLDTLFKENEKLFKLLGSRALLISAHLYKKNAYDFLFVVDLQKISKFTQLKDYLDKVLSDTYTFTRRTYKNHEIIELLDHESKETLSIAILENLLVASYTNSLTEAAIDEYTDPIIGRDEHYLDIFKKVGHDNMFRLYLQQKYLDDFAKCYMDAPNESITYISKHLWYSGFSFDVDDQLLIADGYTNFNDTQRTYIEALQKSGLGKHTIAEIAPQRTAFYLSLGFDSFERFYDNFEALKKEQPEEFAAYQENITKTEKFLDIDLKRNFIDWMDDEVAFLQLQPSRLGRKNEFAIILKSKDGDDAKEQLEFVLKQIKKKTPVKFRKVAYRGYDINFMAIKGFFKLLLGKFFKDLEKPYFIMIEDYVVFSNHPQTLKNFIDDYELKNTLNTSKDYNAFIKEFDNKSNLFAYINMPLFHKNMSAMVSPETRLQLQKNKNYITCFSQIGLQLTASGAIFESKLAAQFRDPKTFRETLQFTDRPNTLLETTFGPSLVTATTTTNSNHLLLQMVEDEELIKIQDITPDDLNTKKYTETYDDGTLKVQVTLKNGMKHGTYRMFHPNGTIKIKGHFKKDQRVGVWKVYDDKGHRLEKKRY